MTDTLHKYHLALDVGHQITLEHIDHMVEAAEEKLDWLLDGYNAWGELRWFIGYLRIILPPGPTGYFSFEMDLVRKIARLNGVEHLVIDALQELSPKGVRMPLHFLHPFTDDRLDELIEAN